MCTFVTLLVPKEAVAAGLSGTFAKHNFGSHEMHNASLSKVMPGMVQFLPLGNQCNCSTALGAVDHLESDPINDLDKAINKLLERGWSKAKVARWRAEKERARGGRSEHRQQGIIDELENWVNLIRSLLSANIKSVALIIHFYNGRLDDAHIPVSGLHRVRLSELAIELLSRLESDVLYEFVR